MMDGGVGFALHFSLQLDYLSTSSTVHCPLTFGISISKSSPSSPSSSSSSSSSLSFFTLHSHFAEIHQLLCVHRCRTVPEQQSLISGQTAFQRSSVPTPWSKQVHRETQKKHRAFSTDHVLVVLGASGGIGQVGTSLDYGAWRLETNAHANRWPR